MRANAAAAREDGAQRHPLDRIATPLRSPGEIVRALNGWASEDRYLCSPAYHMMTGRHGLWSARDGSALIAAHPNRSDEYLLFCKPGAETEADRLLRQAGRTARPIRVARCSNQQAARFRSLGGNGLSYLRVREQTLDWRYPVHVLDARAVVGHRGPAFKDFRGNLNHARAQGFTVTPLRTLATTRPVRDLEARWAAQMGRIGYSRRDVVGPLARLLELLDERSLALDGLVVGLRGRAVGLTIWEQRRGQQTANSLIAIADRDQRGVSELVYHAMCETLLAHGAHLVDIGGSETEGLDRFKRKMNPAISLPLCSLLVRDR